jgi:hypothetical protein
MWAVAVYDFHLTTEQFYKLTPGQWLLLWKRYREALSHREMTAGYTTAAVYNSGFARPESTVSALDFMPSHQAYETPHVMTEEELQEESDRNLAALRLRLSWKQKTDG